MVDAAVFSVQIREYPLFFVALTDNRKHITIIRSASDLSEIDDPLLLGAISYIDDIIPGGLSYERQSFAELFSRKKRRESIKRQATSYIITLSTEFADEILDKDINDFLKYIKNYKQERAKNYGKNDQPRGCDKNNDLWQECVSYWRAGSRKNTHTQ